MIMMHDVTSEAVNFSVEPASNQGSRHQLASFRCWLHADTVMCWDVQTFSVC